MQVGGSRDENGIQRTRSGWKHAQGLVQHADAQDCARARQKARGERAALGHRQDAAL